MVAFGQEVSIVVAAIVSHDQQVLIEFEGLGPAHEVNVVNHQPIGLKHLLAKGGEVIGLAVNLFFRPTRKEGFEFLLGDVQLIHKRFNAQAGNLLLLAGDGSPEGGGLVGEEEYHGHLYYRSVSEGWV